MDMHIYNLSRDFPAIFCALLYLSFCALCVKPVEILKSQIEMFLAPSGTSRTSHFI